MRIEIQNTVKRISGNEHLNNQMNQEFVNILSNIQEKESFDHLLKSNLSTICFEMGKGADHIWFKQIGYMDKGNVITVYRK